MNDEPKRPTIDERLEAIIQTLELAEIERKQMDARERRGRLALLAGIEGYLKALQSPDDEPQEPQP